LPKNEEPSNRWVGWRKLAQDLDSIIGDLQVLREALKSGATPSIDAALHRGMIEAALEALVVARKSASLAAIREERSW